jgi:hypothetical protein
MLKRDVWTSQEKVISALGFGQLVLEANFNVGEDFS